MSARLTVVFDNDELYRRAKIRAAEDGVPLKRVVEEALSAYLEGAKERPKRWVTGAEMLKWAEDAAKYDDDPDGPMLDLSDIKHHLYGYPKRRLTPENFTEFVEALQPSKPDKREAD
jgi:hypothetical protein